MILSILIFLLVLSILVLVHEIGHFLVAKKAGIRIEEFGLGYPPRIYGKKIGETLYSINLFPFGGFVKLYGEESGDKLSEPKRAFVNKNKLVKLGVVVAGVVMNFLLAVLCFGITYSFSGVPRDTHQVRVVDVDTESPANSAGVKSQDVILEVDNEPVDSTSGFISKIDSKKGVKVSLKVDRGGQILYTDVTPRVDPPGGKGALGVVISSNEIYYPPVWLRPFYGAYFGFKEALFWGGMVIAGFGQIIGGLLGGSIPKGVAGPVGIYALTSKAASFGLLPLINFVGILSVNLAILNIMPIPALDGGRLVFILVEIITRKKVSPRFEATVHMVGMILLLTLVFAITAKDITSLISVGSISGFLDSITN